MFFFGKPPCLFLRTHSRFIFLCCTLIHSSACLEAPTPWRHLILYTLRRNFMTHSLTYFETPTDGRITHDCELAGFVSHILGIWCICLDIVCFNVLKAT